MPEADDDVEIELNWDEIRVDTFRSSGAGGQHVQKTESAIRLTHLPTGIVVTCQNERSATQNRELAIRVLKSRLLELELEKREEELRKLRGEHVTAGWGNQIRSYVLHPYQMVKDLRSGHETSNTGAVLDGDLDAFMQAELERLATGRPAEHRRRQRTTDRWRSIDAEGPGGATAGGAVAVPARDRATTSTPAPASGGPAIEDYQCAARPAVDARGPRPAPAAARPPAGHGPGAVLGRGRGPDEGEVVGFASATVREGLWFLAMLFVLPGTPGARHRSGADGPRAGRDGACDPGGPAVPGPDDPLDSGIHTWGMCTDAVQPISNGAVRAARHGAPDPDLAAVRGGAALVRRCRRCPPRSRRSRSRRVAATEPDGARGASRRSVDELDRALIGAAHPADHGFLRREGRGGFLRPRSRRRPRPRVRVRLGRRAAGAACSPLDPALHPALVGVAVRETPMLGRGGDVGARAPRTWPRGRCSTPGCGSTGSRGSCAGRARTTRSSATCRSRSRRRVRDCLTRTIGGAGASLRGTWLPRTCPRSESSPRPLAEPAHDPRPKPRPSPTPLPR